MRPNTIKRNLCYKQNCFLLTLGRKQNIRAGRTLSSVFLKIVLMVDALRRRKSNFLGAISLVLLIISSEQRWTSNFSQLPGHWKIYPLSPPKSACYICLIDDHLRREVFLSKCVGLFSRWSFCWVDQNCFLTKSYLPIFWKV